MVCLICLGIYRSILTTLHPWHYAPYPLLLRSQKSIALCLLPSRSSSVFISFVHEEGQGGAASRLMGGVETSWVGWESSSWRFGHQWRIVSEGREEVMYRWDGLTVPHVIFIFSIIIISMWNIDLCSSTLDCIWYMHYLQFTNLIPN
jgi:hypothetical protein